MHWEESHIWHILRGKPTDLQIYPEVTYLEAHLHLVELDYLVSYLTEAAHNKAKHRLQLQHELFVVNLGICWRQL